MRYHSFDRVRICETTGMQDGYLRIDVVNSENNFPIKGAEAVSYTHLIFAAMMQRKWLVACFGTDA